MNELVLHYDGGKIGYGYPHSDVTLTLRDGSIQYPPEATADWFTADISSGTNRLFNGIARASEGNIAFHLNDMFLFLTFTQPVVLTGGEYWTFLDGAYGSRWYLQSVFFYGSNDPTIVSLPGLPQWQDGFVAQLTPRTVGANDILSHTIGSHTGSPPVPSGAVAECALTCRSAAPFGSPVFAVSFGASDACRIDIAAVVVQSYISDSILEPVGSCDDVVGPR